MDSTFFSADRNVAYSSPASLAGSLRLAADSSLIEGMIPVVRPKSQYADLSGYDSSYQLLEESRKSWDYFVSDKIVYLLNVVNVAGNPLVGIAKEYREGNVWLEVHFSVSRNLVKGNTDYVATLEFSDSDNGFGKHKFDDTAVNRNSSVLVNVAQQIKTPQKMTLAGFGIPTIVRLKCLDDFRSSRRNSLGLLREPRSISVVKNRKLGLDGVINRKLRQAPNKMVKGRAKTIERISQNKGNLVRRVFNLTPNSVPTIFTIFLGGELIRLRFVEDTQFLPESTQVFLRPGCLQVGVRKV